MDMEKEYSCLERNSLVYRKSIDNNADYQEALQQFSDDIYRVVKCSAHSYVVSLEQNYNEVKVYGKTEIAITYYNENSVLSYADFEEDFSVNVSVENLSDSAFASATVCDKYTNFRVINQRRIDVHVANSINLCVYDKISSPCLSSCSNSKLKSKEIRTADIINANVTKIEFDEDFSIPTDSVPIKRVVSQSSFVTINESKIIKDKVLIKAIVSVSVLYTTDEDEEQIAKCEYSFDISKIIDISGIDEEDIIISQATMGNVFLKAKNVGTEKLSVIEVYGEVSVSSVFIREASQKIITDGYVLNKNSNCNYSKYNCLKNGKLVNDNQSHNLTFEFNNDIKEIKELSIFLAEPTVRDILHTTVYANILCVNSEGSISNYTSSTQLDINIEDCKNAVASLSMLSYDYNLVDNKKLNVRLSLNVNAYVYEDCVIDVLSEIEVGDDYIDYPTLTVYFGKQNESIWNIAKSFSSDIDLIINENDLSTDVLETNKVLIIPGV